MNRSTLAAVVVALMLGSGIAGYLKVRLGVSEIISTIMLNAIALQITDWLFNDFFRFDDASGTLDVRTKPIPESGWMPDILGGKVNGYVIVALIVCVVYHILVNKSRFGFRLRASGLNANAASTSGISSGRMVMIAMLIFTPSCAAVLSSACVIWKPPSPAIAQTSRSGTPRAAPMAAGMLKPIVPRPPELICVLGWRKPA